MSLSPEQVTRIAHLARLELAPEDAAPVAADLSRIIDFVAQLGAAATEEVEPMAHPLNMQQRLRPDVVTEANQRECFQQNALTVEAGLYLVPRVIE